MQAKEQYRWVTLHFKLHNIFDLSWLNQYMYTVSESLFLLRHTLSGQKNIL